MTHWFLDEAGQLDLKAHLKDVPEVLDALAGVTCDGYRQRISYEPKVDGGSQSHPLPYDTTVQDASDYLVNELATWVRHVIECGGPQYSGSWMPLDLAQWLDRHITSLAMTPGSEEAPAAIGQAVKKARRAARMSSSREEWRNGSAHVARAARLNARGIEQAAKELGPEYAKLDIERVQNLRRTKRIEPVGDYEGELIYRLGDVMAAHLSAKTRRRTA